MTDAIDEATTLSQSNDVTPENVINPKFLPCEIEETGLLPLADLEFLNADLVELEEVWSKRQIYRTVTEMHISVLNDVKFPTRASKYWQAARERSAFYENLVRSSFEFKRLELKIKQKRRKIEAEADDIDKELLEIDLQEMLFERKGQKATARDRIRELREWKKIMADLDDGSFDKDDVNTHQLNSYNERFHRELSASQGTNMSSGEAQNLIGQIRTTERVVKEANLALSNNSEATALPSNDTPSEGVSAKFSM